jgi:methionine-rich copper-binding protein CopC
MQRRVSLAGKESTCPERMKRHIRGLRLYYSCPRFAPPIFGSMRFFPLRSILSAAVLVAGVTGFAPAPALAGARAARTAFHAHLVRAEPAVNDTIASTPRAVRLWFSEPVELGLSRIRIVRLGGDTVKTSALRHEGDASTTAALDLATPPSAPGTYLVTYRVVSRDGHPTSGSYSFVLKGAGSR